MLTQSDDEVLLLINPRCSKCRALRDALTQSGVAFRERRYLEDPLTRKELGELFERFEGEPQELVRWKEAETRTAGIERTASAQELLHALTRFPSLLERPVLVRGARAAVGRPGPPDALRILDAR